MTPARSIRNKAFIAQDSYWVRAPHGGTFRALKKVGDHVEDGERIAIISDPFGSHPVDVFASQRGIVIGMSHIPLINRGDAMMHIATFKNLRRVKEALLNYDYLI